VRGAGAAFAALALLTGAPGPAAAQEPERQVFLFLVDREEFIFAADGISYEEALHNAPFRRLAGNGGLGLMTTLRGEETGAAAYLSLGAGATVPGPADGPVAEPSDGGLQLDVGSYVETSDGLTPGLLGAALRNAGRTVAYLDLLSTEPDSAMLTAMDDTGKIPVAFQNAFPAVTHPEVLPGAVAPFDQGDLVVMPGISAVDFALANSPADEVLVIVASPGASSEMRAQGDMLTPLVVVRGPPDSLLVGGRPVTSGLTSDTTRRQGIVSNVDVAPTILEYLDVQVPAEMLGSPIRVDGKPPTELHDRYLEYRRTGPVVGVTVLLLAIASLLAGLAVLAVRRLAPLRRAVSVWVLGSVAALVALQPASLLPAFELPVVAGTVLAVTALITWAGLRAGRGGPFVPMAVVAGIGLGLEVLDAALGWPTGLTPLLSGGALEGVRFYGLGNSYAGIVLGGAVLVAARLGRAGAGAGIIAAAAAFAGLPFVGADIGGGLTLFAVAGLWFGLRHPARPRAVRWALAAGIVLAGAAFLLAANRLFPEGAPHISRASGEGIGGLLGSLFDRLGNNLRTTAQAPAAWLALGGLPVWLVVAWRKLGPFRAPLDNDPVWRDAVVTLTVGAMIGYVLNDTFGMAAVAFVFVSSAMVYPALRWTAR
jgi:hypothetical protein